MRVLGVDPGFERLGIAVLEKTKNGEGFLVYSKCFNTLKDLSFTKRLELLSKEIEGVINKFEPEVLSIESLFFNKNQKTVMRVSEVRGAIINTALSKKLQIYEFTPLQIKVAVTGYGKSDKKQVMSMVKNLIKIDRKIDSDDEFDAIAVGLTFLASEKTMRQIEGFDKNS